MYSSPIGFLTSLMFEDSFGNLTSNVGDIWPGVINSFCLNLDLLKVELLCFEFIEYINYCVRGQFDPEGQSSWKRSTPNGPLNLHTKSSQDILVFFSSSCIYLPRTNGWTELHTQKHLRLFLVGKRPNLNAFSWHLTLESFKSSLLHFRIRNPL